MNRREEAITDFDKMLEETGNLQQPEDPKEYLKQMERYILVVKYLREELMDAGVQRESNVTRLIETFFHYQFMP